MDGNTPGWERSENMLIPIPTEKVKLECLGLGLFATVDSVAARAKHAATFPKVTLRVSDDFQKGDIVYWLNEAGKRIRKTQVREVSWRHGVNKIVVGAIPRAKSRR